MNKKCIALLIALVLIPATLFAVPVVVTWEWMLEDPMVTTFRYQIDGEADDQWTVVDASVTSYTVRGLDGSKSHTLYLQQSYDGKYFSASALSVSEPILAPEPETVAVATEVLPVVEETATPVAEKVAPVVEEVVVPIAEKVAPVTEEVVVPVAEKVAPVTEEVVVPVAEKVAPVVEEVVVPVAEKVAPVTEEVVVPVAEKVAPVTEEVVAPVAEKVAPVVEKESRYSTTITLGAGLNYQFTTITGYNPYNIQASLGVQLNNLMSFNNSFGLGVDIGVTYNPYLASSVANGWMGVLTNAANWSFVDHTATISIAPVLNMEFGKVVANIGIGGFFTYGPEFNSSQGKPYMYGAFAKVGLGYKLNSWFSVGIEGKYGFVLSDPARPQFAEGGLYLGFSF